MKVFEGEHKPFMFYAVEKGLSEEYKERGKINQIMFVAGLWLDYQQDRLALARKGIEGWADDTWMFKLDGYEIS